MNNFIKYNFIIRTPTQILYEFRTRKTFNLLRIDNLDSFIPKTTPEAKNVTITIYPTIIKSAIAENDIFIETENDFSINRISSLKVIIFVRKKLITFSKKTFFIKETPFIATSRIIIINEYRSSYIDIKDAIAFASLKIKKIYDK